MGVGTMNILSNLSFLVCPVMMVGMMIMMMKGQKGSEDTHNHCNQKGPQEQVEKLEEKVKEN